MTHTAEFLIFGATGQQGGAVARTLRRAGRQSVLSYGIRMAKWPGR